MNFTHPLLILLLLIVSIDVLAKNAEIQPLAPKSLLLDISQTRNALIAVGERGHIVVANKTNNEPAESFEWRQKPVPTAEMLTGVFALETGQVWAVGHGATILYSPDHGETWTIQFQDFSLEKPFFDILFFNDKQGIAIGAYGLFMRTLDGGLTWHKELHATLLPVDDIEYLNEIKQSSEDEYQEELAAVLPHLNKLAFANGDLWVVGEAGLIAKSIDQGTTWYREDEIYAGSFFDVQITDEFVIVAGLRGHVFQRVETDWQPLHSKRKTSINQIIILPNNQFLILANSNLLSLYNDNIGYQDIKKLSSKSQTSGLFYKNHIITVGELGISAFKFPSAY
ncbi:WD40/YVTN/BNR-like repeat-containing protein [Algibacillus agarilyticus]|uniref:WD40/YVTN/BNR-like repeat-containing protein n=1 Tax=Algibacillus agarilyticus TaxID=2234133 RepID=UPI0013007793|nr:YCF48-related protein [Algibacillus agarilyticus]